MVALFRRAAAAAGAAALLGVRADRLPQCEEEPALVVVVEEVPAQLPDGGFPGARELLDRFAESVFRASLAGNSTFDTLSGARAELPGGHHMRVVPAGPNRGTARAEFLLCGEEAEEAGPVGAYRVAAAAKESLVGAGGMPGRWAARLKPEPDNLNLLYYWRVFGDMNQDKELLSAHTSNFSSIAIWRIGDEKRLMLNDVIMSDTSDEHIYHETLVHPALLATESPKRVLVVGGGEGATVREILRDPRVESVTMVEIDEDLVRLCKEHLDSMHDGSFTSKRLTLVYDDGVEFVRRAGEGSYDVVIVDGTDFSYVPASDYGNVLFSGSFYRDTRRILAEGGVFAQYVSSTDPRRELIAAGFNKTASFGVDIASFMGDGARLVFATGASAGDEEDLGQRIQRAIADSPAQKDWKYLSPQNMELGLSHKGRRMKGADHCCCNNDNAYTASTDLGGLSVGSCTPCAVTGETCMDNSFIWESALWIPACYSYPNMHACDDLAANFCCCGNSTSWNYATEECELCQGPTCHGKTPVDGSDHWWQPCAFTADMYQCFLPLAHSGAYEHHCCCYPGNSYTDPGSISFWLFSQLFPFSHPCTPDPPGTVPQDSVIPGSDSWVRCAPGTYTCSEWGSLPDNSWGGMFGNLGHTLLFMVLNLCCIGCALAIVCCPCIVGAAVVGGSGGGQSEIELE